MRITNFTNSYKPAISGVVTSISSFRLGLLNAGQEVQVIAPKYSDYVDQDAYIFRFPSVDLNDVFNLALTLPIKSLIEPTIMGIKPDVIHSHHPILMGDMAATFAQELSIPLVFTFHTRYERYLQEYASLVPELSGKLAETIVRRYLQKCDHVIAPTRYIHDLVESYGVDVPTTIIPTPIDMQKYDGLSPDRARDLLGVEGAQVLMYLGRLSPEKNLDFLLRAFEMVYDQQPNTRLVIVGDGPIEHQLLEQVRKAKIETAVIFSGPIPYEDVPDYMAAADLFVFPSPNETQGLVLLEALAAGTPVVAIQTPVNADILSSGGGLLASEDESAFASTVLDVLEKPQFARTLKEKTSAAIQDYQLEHVVERLVAVYQSVSGQSEPL